MKKMKIPYDETIRRYEANEKKKTITVLDGFKKSSNYVFRYLTLENYRNQSKEYISRLYEYKLGEAVKFDLTEKGGTSPSLPDPESKYWTLTDLASCAIGYTVKETPLNMLTTIGTRMAKVPQEVPVEKPRKRAMRNMTAGTKMLA